MKRIVAMTAGLFLSTVCTRRSAAVWIQRGIFAGGAAMGGEVQDDSEAGKLARIHETADGAAAQRWVGVRQRERGMDCGEVQGVRTGNADRKFRRVVSDAEGATDRVGRRGAVFQGEDGRAGAAGRPDFESKERAVADVQRLFD